MSDSWQLSERLGLCVCASKNVNVCMCVCVCLSVFGESLWLCQLRHIPEDPSSGCPAPLAFLAHTQLMPSPGDTLVSDTRSARGGKQQERSHAMCWTYRHGKGMVCTHKKTILSLYTHVTNLYMFFFFWETPWNIGIFVHTMHWFR